MNDTRALQTRLRDRRIAIADMADALERLVIEEAPALTSREAHDLLVGMGEVHSKLYDMVDFLLEKSEETS